MNLSEVYVEKRNVYEYPAGDDAYSPHVFYPEYPWEKNTLSKSENAIYDMVRQSFFKLNFDRENFGTVRWNPLGALIKPGNCVLIKPNMVLHENHIPELGVECVVTHPSLVRAVTDYVWIALKRSGSVCIGDAPLQSCDYDKMLQNAGYLPLIDFYEKNAVKIRFQDFRLICLRRGDGRFQDVQGLTGDELGYTAVDLGKESLHMEHIENFQKLRVTNYDPHNMRQHHNPQKNEYLVPTSVLQADVVINMPKPKSHRKGGVTIAMKNLIGINGHKDWLPHHKKGALHNGGDEYLSRNPFKALAVNVQEWIDILTIRKKTVLLPPLRVLRTAFAMTGKGVNILLGKDTYTEGSWYGNDTIWRTIGDLNRILFYSDKQGRMQRTLQRKCLIVADMIVSGEGEGPLQPAPKKTGMIAGGTDPVAFDAAIAALMGFDYNKIPSIYKNCSIHSFALTKLTSPGDTIIRSNYSAWDARKVDTIKGRETLHFMPSKGWEGHIELF